MALAQTVWNFTGTTTGDGSPKLTPDPNVACSMVFQVVLASTGTMSINGWVDGATALALFVTNLHDGTTTNSITASGLYRVDATGLVAVWPNVSANATGIVVTGQQVQG